MTATCPICGKPVDTLRSRHVKVRGIQVVAYCSAECLASAETQPVAVPKAHTPATGVVKSGVVPDSGPVIEIRYEPASGVVTSAPDQRTAPVPKVEPEKEVIPKVDLVKLKKQEKDRAKSEPKITLAKAESKVETKPEPKTEKQPEPKVAAKSEPKPAAKPEPKAEPKPDASPEKETAKIDKKRLEVIEQTSTPKGSGTSVTGARKRGRATMQRDESNHDQAEDWLDDEPANVGAVRAGTDVGDVAPRSSGGKRVFVTLLIVAILAGGGVLAYKLTRKQKAAPTTPSASGSQTSQPSGSDGSGSGSGSALKPRVVGPGSQADIDPPANTKEQLAKATAILKRHLAGNTSRIQRTAAVALARTGDPAALERLATAIAKSEDGRFQSAYALARAGDKRGLDVLYASLGAPSRDDKLEAATKLADLGDKRGADTLANYLEVSQNRFGAAELLTRLGDPRGIKILDQIRADAKASTDDKARATVALSYAGEDVVEDLHKLLTDTHFNINAAEALAARHDEAARPVLTKQLGVSSLRVRAARAMRRLAPDHDLSSHLKALTAALDEPANQHDTELVDIAESILLLGGPATWAERK